MTWPLECPGSTAATKEKVEHDREHDGDNDAGDAAGGPKSNGHWGMARVCITHEQPPCRSGGSIRTGRERNIPRARRPDTASDGAESRPTRTNGRRAGGPVRDD